MFVEIAWATCMEASTSRKASEVTMRPKRAMSRVTGRVLSASTAAACRSFAFSFSTSFAVLQASSAFLTDCATASISCGAKKIIWAVVLPSFVSFPSLLPKPEIFGLTASTFSDATPSSRSRSATSSGSFLVRTPSFSAPTSDLNKSDVRQLRLRHWLDIRPRVVPPKVQVLGAPVSSRFRFVGG